MQIIYLKTKTPVSIGDKIKVDNITITITQQFIDDNKGMFEVVEETRYWKCIKEDFFRKFSLNKIYKLNDNKTINDEYAFIDNNGEYNGMYYRNAEFFTPSTEQEYLLQIAKEKYPVGTRFKSVQTGVIFTVKTNSHRYVKYLNGTGIDVEGVPYVYCEGKWAEVLKPILKTEDGKELYEGDSYWFCGIDGTEWKDKSMTNYTSYFVQYTEDKEFSNKCKFFSTKEACQAYIDEHKEKSLNDYEKMFTKLYERSGSSFYVGLINELKSKFPELYWYKIALLIRDDLNGSDCVILNGTDRIYSPSKDEDEDVIMTSSKNQLSGPFNFKDVDKLVKFSRLLGDKINYLF